MKTVIISDIHMGIDAPTNWYRIDPHEAYLVYILQWILNNQNEIEELIILGDLFDFWTYPPNIKPPSAADIIAKNPKTLGPNGLISQILDALNGRVSYLHGNHDITTTQDDLNGIGNSIHKVQLKDDIYVKDDVVYTHGHLYTLFNAPDLKGANLPVGHFVTRALSYLLQQKQEQAVDEPGFGAENMGYGGLSGILNDVEYLLLHPSVTQNLLDIVQSETGIPDNFEILLERNFGTMTYKEAKEQYKDLFSEWMNEYNQGEGNRGLWFAYSAAYADYDGHYLSWFAQQLAFEYCANLVVMGHTHIPRKGISGNISNYINCGFECVPKPDMTSHQMTFSVVDSANGQLNSAAVMSVTKDASGNFQMTNTNPPEATIFKDTDYSCYVMVVNNSVQNYTLQNYTASYGYFTVLPPQTIPAGGTVKLWIEKNDLVIAGSEGQVTYIGQNSGRVVNLEFACTLGPSFLNPNTCSGADKFYTKSGGFDNPWSDEDWGDEGKVAKSDEPLFVKFIINQ